MSQESISCVEPVTDGATAQAAAAPAVAQAVQGSLTVARVGQKAPEFTAMAYLAGEFRKVSLADYRGQWVMLCFYPGDFTFV